MENEESGSLGTINDDEFTEFNRDATGPQREAAFKGEESKKRGRKKIPEKWTRVMAIE